MSFSAQGSSQVSARTSIAQLRALESSSIAHCSVSTSTPGQRHASVVSGNARHRIRLLTILPTCPVPRSPR